MPRLYTPEEFWEHCRTTRWDGLNADETAEYERTVARIATLGRVAQVQPELVPLFDAWCRWAREGGKQPLLSDYANQSRGQLSVYSTL